MLHFRLAGAGEVTPKLCHPFPVTATATTRLTGHTRAVLFHNGTWIDWRETLRRMPAGRVTDAPLSDSRVAASLVDLAGSEVLERLPGRWVFFERDFTELFGTWERWGGMKVSNLGFTHHLPRPQQGQHKLSAACGTPDTRKRRK